MKKLLVLIISISLFTSCSIEKRTFNKGYYVKWNIENKKQNHAIKPIEKKEKLHEDLHIEYINPYTKVESIELTSNIDSSVNIIKEVTLPLISQNTKDEKCDNIILKNGEEIKVKVIEIGISEIKYKKCDNLEGPIFSIEKSKVLIILYPNGTRDVIESEEPPSSNNSNQNYADDVEKVDNLALWSFITSIIGLTIFGALLFGTIAVILGIMASNRIEKNPDKYSSKTKKFSSIGIGLGFLSIILVVLFLTVFVF